MNFDKLKEETEKFLSNGAVKSFFMNGCSSVEDSFIEKLKKFLDDDIKSLSKNEKEVLFFIIQNMIGSQTMPLKLECRNLRIKMNAVLTVLGILVVLIGSFVVPLSMRIMNGG